MLEFDLVWNSVGFRSRQAMRIAGNLLIGGLCLTALPASWDYASFMGREGSPVLGISFKWVFMPFVILLAAVAALHALILATVVFRALTWRSR
jgi:TRAP-type C4-dicarboxylate transport system permease small subunit